MIKKLKNRVGEKYGMLTIIGTCKSGIYYMAKVRCDCGVEKNTQMCSLLSGNTASCGCKRYKKMEKNEKIRLKIIKGGVEVTTQSYYRIHRILCAKYGKAKKCEFSDTHIGKRYEYALKKGCTYSEDIQDYIQLCPSCHRKYDITDEIRKKMSASRSGRPNPKLSEKMKGVPKPECRIPVIQFNKEGVKIAEYDSIGMAAESTGIIRTGIANNLSGRARSSGGYSWAYKQII